MREADRTTDDSYTRMNLFLVGYGALSFASVYDEAYDFMSRDSHSADYIMLALAGWAQCAELPSEALSSA